MDGRADIYALGVMIHEALGGAPPFTGRSAQEVLLSRLVREAPPLRVAGLEVAVANVVAHMLARRADDRYLSAEAVLAELGRSVAVPLRWLGSRRPVEALVAAARTGRSIDVWPARQRSIARGGGGRERPPRRRTGGGAPGRWGEAAREPGARDRRSGWLAPAVRRRGPPPCVPLCGDRARRR